MFLFAAGSCIQKLLTACSRNITQSIRNSHTACFKGFFKPFFHMLLLLFCNRCIFIHGTCCFSEILMTGKKHYIYWCSVFFHHIQIFYRIIYIDTTVASYCCGHTHTQHSIKDTEFDLSVLYRIFMHMNVDKTRSHYFPFCVNDLICFWLIFCYGCYFPILQHQV